MQHIFRIHRGITHSLPFTILWPILITFLIFTFFSGTNPFGVWMWAQLRSIFTCLCRYIQFLSFTQALRPITNKWIQLSVINTFDPIIFTVLCIGIVLWL
ncbi:metal-dependent hydrolase [Staphylococcus aureus]